MGEFDLIRCHFADLAGGPGVALGVGDDAALLAPTAGQHLVACTDTLVEGRHFLPGSDAAALGWKALAVNLSDLAAMGATPRWCLLALTLPEADDDWLTAFASGLADCARTHGVALVGGDTTRGPLTLTVTALGDVPTGQAMRRDGAQPGDCIALAGVVGEAAAGLAVLRDGLDVAEPHRQTLVDACLRPKPLVHVGQVCAGLAHAAIDVSDGLIQDLQHVLTASGVGAALDRSALPQSPALRAAGSDEQRRAWMLGGGDDYALLLTLTEAALETANLRLKHDGLPELARIGTVRDAPGVVDAADGTTVSAPGFSHF